MSSVERQIQDLVQAIFNNRQAEELNLASREVAAEQSDLISRSLGNSGRMITSVTRAYEQCVIRTVERTLEELALHFRQSGRKDWNLFWNIVDPKIKDLALSFSRSANATAAQRLQGQNQTLVARQGQNSYVVLQQILGARVHENRMKSQFLSLKTPDDRRANGIPDVAVMMWFPDPEKFSAAQVQESQSRYQAIKDAVYEASNGLATVNKFDDPGVVPQDRISAAIEVWLEKAVLVICDLAGQRHNVYYEFGYTRAMGTDVLLTYPKEESANVTLHLGQWQGLRYTDNNELKTELVPKIKVLLSKYDLSGTV